MYSPSTVDRSISHAVSLGFPRPRRHTRAEIDRWIAHFDSLVVYDPDELPEDDQKKLIVIDRGGVLGPVYLSRPFTKTETAFIENELLLCRLDFRYWVNNYVWITDEANRRVRFTLWTSQEIFLDLVAEMEENAFAVLMIILKARQLGISRIISLIILHMVHFHAFVNATMASSDDDKSNKLFGMYEFPYDQMPFWMQCEIKGRRVYKLVEYENGSGITVQAGAQTRGIMRGSTPTVFHLTELAEFESNGGDPASLVDSALLRAVHDNPNVRGFLEGTAEGKQNWWHRTWTSELKRYSVRQHRLRPVFLPWVTGGLYPTETWLRQHPVPETYVPEQYVLDHKASVEAYVRSSPYLAKWMPDYRMSITQMWFYQIEYGRAHDKGGADLRKFYQEMPGNPDEAFQNTNDSVFSTETIVYYRTEAVRQPILGVYGLQASSNVLAARLQPYPNQIDPNRPKIEVRWPWGTGYPIDFTLVPLKWDGLDLDTGHNKVFIWEHPEDGQVYGAGVDLAYGVGQDSSCIEMIRKGTPWERGKQVAEFNSPDLGALDTVPFVMALAAYYGVRNGDGILQQPKLCIECIGNGDQTQSRIRLHGYSSSSFHSWIKPDNKNLDLSNFHKIGVFTNQWFREQLMEYLLKMLRDQEFIICSKWFVGEMESLEMEYGAQSIRAVYGGHDDRIMALGFVLVDFHRWDRFRVGAPETTPGLAVGGLTPGAMERIREEEERRKAQDLVVVHSRVVQPERRYATWAYNQQETELPVGAALTDEQWLQRINQRAERWRNG